MRLEERWCAERLRAFLENGITRISIEPGADPPDIILLVGTERWAVEHTTLQQYADHGGEEISRPGVDGAAIKLVERLTVETARTRRSGWIMVIDGPLPRSDLRAIEKAARNAIEKNDSMLFAGISPRKSTLEQTSDANLRIQLISMLRPGSRIPGSVRLTADIQAQVNYALERILREKCPVLGAEIAYSRRALLLQNGNPLANSDNVARGLRKLSELATGIDMIFLLSVDATISLVWGSLPSVR